MKAPKLKGKTVTFSITVPEILARRIEKKLGINATDTHSRYFTELAARDIASGGGVSQVIVSG